MNNARRWNTALNRLTLLAALGVACALPVVGAERGPASAPVSAASAPASAGARVIVKFRSGSSTAAALSANTAGVDDAERRAQALSTRLGLALTNGRAMGPRLQLLKASGLSSQELADQLNAQSDVEYAVVDGRKQAYAATPNDPLYLNTAATQTPAVGQWYLRAPSSTLVAAINAEAAWNVTTGKATIVVADLDTGVRFDHPDLASKLLPGYDFVSDLGTANDGDLRDADASDPGDWVASAQATTTCPVANSSWHGTQTAGLIGAATNNALGMASVGRDVMVMPLRVLGRCGGYDSDIIDAMHWAAGIAVPGLPANPHPARVVNMSLGASGACTADYQDAVNDLIAANVAVVVAAGNDGFAVGSPADCNGVIAVTGVRHIGTKVGYSSLGPNATIAAPAGNCVNTTGTCLYPILTTSNSGTTTPVAGAAGATYTGGGTDMSLGTSFSTPMVSGTVALMLSANADLTPAQIISALKSSARPFPSSGADAGVAACRAPSSIPQTSECYCTTSTCGAGLLDAGAAVAAAAAATANIHIASTALTAGTAVTLDGSSSRASQGASIVAYQWAVTGGDTLASITSSTTASSITLLPSAAGSATVSLTVTDSLGHSDTATTTLTIAAAPVTVVTPPATPPPATSADTGGSSGGGALGGAWLLGLALALVGSWRLAPRRAVVRARR